MRTSRLLLIAAIAASVACGNGAVDGVGLSSEQPFESETGESGDESPNDPGAVENPVANGDEAPVPSEVTVTGSVRSLLDGELVSDELEIEI
ncbi:MAG: hypothetical protein AAF658_17100, partial [Myxococcota bacterium]